jgi:hypothetical protein
MAAGLPTAILCEIEFTAGVWTDVSSRWTEPVDIVRGRTDSASDVQPTVITVELENNDGALTPDNPLSQYFPNVVEGKRLRIRVTKGATSTRFLGRITALDPELTPDLVSSIVKVTATDKLGDLQKIPMESALRHMIRGEIPQDWFPLDGGRGAGRIQTALRDGTGVFDQLVWSGTPGFGESDGPDGSACTSLVSGSTLYATNSSNPQTTGQVGVWVKLEPESPESMFLLAYLDDTISSVDYFGQLILFTSSTGKLRAIRSYNNTPFDTIYDGSTDLSPVSIADGAWHFILWDEMNSPSKRPLLFLDGVKIAEPGLSIGSYASGIRKVRLGAGATGKTTLAHVFFTTAPYNAGLARDVWAAGAPGAGGITLSAWADWLDYWSGQTIAFDGTSTKDGTAPDSAGKSALEVALAIARGESGILYHDYASDSIKMRLRSTTRSATVAMTIDATGDLDGAPQLARENTLRVAQATAKNGGLDISAEDSTLLAELGPVSADVEAPLSSEVELYSVASNRISIGRDQKVRFSKLTVDLVTAQTDLYAALFALLPGDRIRVSGSALQTHLGVTYLDGYAEGWTETIGPETFEFKPDLSSAAVIEGVFDTARFAFGDGVCTGSAVTSSGTSLTLTWTGGVALSTSAGDYPVDLDLNGERVTISSPPAGSSSPQTVTIVRGVAPTVARAHAAGEPVEIWNAGRWAY